MYILINTNTNTKTYKQHSAMVFVYRKTTCNIKHQWQPILHIFGAGEGSIQCEPTAVAQRTPRSLSRDYTRVTLYTLIHSLACCILCSPGLHTPPGPSIWHG